MLECKSAPNRPPSHRDGVAGTGQSANAGVNPLGDAPVELRGNGGVVVRPDVAEAAKFVPAFDADFAVLLGPDFENEIELVNELKTHKVTAFTVADLATLLHIGANALEIRTVFDEPGFAMEKVADLVWERRHGRVKRVATLAALVQREGWLSQCTAADQHAGFATPATNGPTASPDAASGANGEQRAADGARASARLNRGDAPRLTVDAAMLLVDAALRAAGSTQACTREEVDAAFTHLTDPLVGSATWLDPSRSAIAILEPLTA